MRLKKMEEDRSPGAGALRRAANLLMRACTIGQERFRPLPARPSALADIVPMGVRVHKKYNIISIMLYKSHMPLKAVTILPHVLGAFNRNFLQKS